MFGDIVKVTPSSKVVGDMALMMVAQNLNREDVENPNTAFESAVPATLAIALTAIAAFTTLLKLSLM